MAWPSHCLRGVQGDGEIKATANAHLTFGPNLATVLLNDFAADGQPKACTPFLSRIRRIDLLETLEDAVQFVGGDTLPLILNTEKGHG